MTKQQELVLKTVAEAMEHLSADEIYLKARTVMPTIAIGTVYRTLKILCERGLVRQIPNAEGPDRYDKNLVPHDHMTCRNCGRFMDISTAGVANEIEREAGIRVLNYELIVSGICPECVASGVTQQPQRQAL